MSGQLSFFSARDAVPAAADLAGLLCGPGQLVRREDDARVSVVLAERWRVEAVAGELALRGLDPEVVAADPADGWAGEVVRTPFTPELLPLAAWSTGGGGKRPPAGLALDAPMLRVWYAAAGRPWEAGHALGLGEHDGPAWAAVGALLAGAGLPATLVGPRARPAGGPAYRLTGRRRLTRLAELVGDPPAGCPDGAWPE